MTRVSEAVLHACAIFIFFSMDVETRAVIPINRVSPADNRTALVASQLSVILEELSRVGKQLDSQSKKLEKLEKAVAQVKCSTSKGARNTAKAGPKDCAELYRSGNHANGIYTIKPDSETPVQVYCDQTTVGGGWTGIQRRLDGSVDFYRGWNDYKKGFGSKAGEYWLGLQNIHRITMQGRYTLRIEISGRRLKPAYAHYSDFDIGSEESNYTLYIGIYSGTAGNSLSRHHGMEFTTLDRDNDNFADGNCAKFYKGAWWYNACLSSNLNGVFYHYNTPSYADGIIWKTWGGFFYSAARVDMMIRPAAFRPNKRHRGPGS